MSKNRDIIIDFSNIVDNRKCTNCKMSRPKNNGWKVQYDNGECFCSNQCYREYVVYKYIL